MGLITLVRLVISLGFANGDIELNPGPTCPCTKCGKAVRARDRGIQCDKCDEWTHAKCCHVNHKQYRRMSSLGESEEWLCPSCCLSTLPFADCSQLSSNISGDTTFNTSSASEITTPPRTTTHGLACTVLNARSIVNKRHDLHALLASEHILCGDFNVPDINWSTTSPTSSCSVASELCDTVNDFALHQLPTIDLLASRASPLRF